MTLLEPKPQVETGTPRKGRSFFYSPEIFSSLFFFALLGICLLIYWPGLSGPFLLDDFENLESLGANNQVHDLHSVVQFVFTGIAGPTGRPLSLLSFLLNDFAWPSMPWSFKYTNLLIHLLNGVLVFWICLRLCRINTRPFICQYSEWLALAAANLWLLHPFHVSTTLYVIQRMASLSALFSLLGILAYLKSREKLQTSPYWGYGLMTASVSFFTLLALFSKESGAILPLLLATVEFTALRHDSRLSRHPHKVWTWVLFGLPALALAAYLVRFLTPNQAAAFIPRGYTAFERLLTEGRALACYLYDLAVPKLYSGSVFNDDFTVSTGLLSPPSTLFSLAGLAILVLIAFLTKKSYPYVSLALSFFFVAHLLESTTVPLELYYEHRNYLASIFLFLPIVYGIESCPKLAVPIVVIALLMMGGFTAAKAKLWGDEPELVLFWAGQHPLSARAQRHAADVYFKLGQNDKVFEILSKATAANPKNLKLRLNTIAFACIANRYDADYYSDTMRLIGTAPVYFDSNIFDMLENLISLIGKQQCHGLTLAQIEQMTDAILANPTVSSSKPNQFLLAHLQAIIALNRKDATLALALFTRALELSANPDTGLLETALLASHGFYPEALQHLQATENLLYSSGMLTSGVLASHDFPMEIERMRKNIREDMAPKLAPKKKISENIYPPLKKDGKGD